MQNIKNIVLILALVIGAIGLFFALRWFGDFVMDRTEVAECTKLEQQSKEYENYFITSWQNDMCRAHGMTFGGTQEAPILINNGESFEAGTWYFNPNVGKFYFGEPLTN